MIITTIKIHGRSQKRKEIIQTIKGLADQMVQFEGCSNANFYQDIANKDIFYLIEEWKTVGDLEKYLKSKSIAVLFGIETLLIESLEIKHGIKCQVGRRVLEGGECG